jgi:hypothetical protein
VLLVDLRDAAHVVVLWHSLVGLFKEVQAQLCPSQDGVAILLLYSRLLVLCILDAADLVAQVLNPLLVEKLLRLKQLRDSTPKRLLAINYPLPDVRVNLRDAIPADNSLLLYLLQKSFNPMNFCF